MRVKWDYRAFFDAILLIYDKLENIGYETVDHRF